MRVCQPQCLQLLSTCNSTIFVVPTLSVRSRMALFEGNLFLLRHALFEGLREDAFDLEEVVDEVEQKPSDDCEAATYP